MTLTRLGFSLGLAAALLLVAGNDVAVADPARPTSYRSEVTEVVPPRPGLKVEILGGDAFLTLEAPPGSTVEVAGYSGEPYLRIEPDGTVSINRRSPAYWVNDDRYGEVPIPEGVSPDAAPDWEIVSEDGRWSWHDHRTHWMSPTPPPGVEGPAAEQVLVWVVPLLVDGAETEVRGTLTWHPPISPLPWLAGVAAATTAILVYSGRQPRAAPIGLLVGGVAASTVSWLETVAAPPGAGGGVVALGAAAATVTAAIVWLWSLLSRPQPATAVAAVGAVILAVWGAQRITALWLPILPTGLPEPLERGLVAIALGMAVGVAGFVGGRLVPPRPHRRDRVSR